MCKHGSLSKSVIVYRGGGRRKRRWGEGYYSIALRVVLHRRRIRVGHCCNDVSMRVIDVCGF